MIDLELEVSLLIIILGLIAYSNKKTGSLSKFKLNFYLVPERVKTIVSIFLVSSKLLVVDS